MFYTYLSELKLNFSYTHKKIPQKDVYYTIR